VEASASLWLLLGLRFRARMADRERTDSICHCGQLGGYSGIESSGSWNFRSRAVCVLARSRTSKKPEQVYVVRAAQVVLHA